MDYAKVKQPHRRERVQLFFYRRSKMLIIQKFGGSSLDGPERLRCAAETVKAARMAGHRCVVVVSAVGDSTDHMAELALEIDPGHSKREWDALLSSGEQQSAALMAMMLGSMGVDAISFTGWQSGIYTNSIHADADVEQTLPWRVSAALRQNKTPVVTGFQGLDIKGDVTTLGRGGSDTTAVALAAALGADRCRIYSDVAGVYTADPRLIKDARHIPLMDMGDMLTLAHSGSQLLHAKSVALAMAEDVELELYSSFGEEQMSVVRRLEDEERPDYAGVTRDKERCQLTIVGKACTVQTLRDISALLKDEGIEVMGGRAGDGFCWVKLMPQQLDFALGLVHSKYFL